MAEVANVHQVREVLEKVFLNIDDLGTLTGACRTTCYSIKKSIIEDMEKQNKRLYSNKLLPTSVVVQWLADDSISYLHSQILEQRK